MDEKEIEENNTKAGHLDLQITSFFKQLEKRFDQLEQALRDQHKKIMNVNEVSTFLGVSTSWVHQAKKEGYLPYHLAKGRLIFFRDEVEQALRDM